MIFYYLRCTDFGDYGEFSCVDNPKYDSESAFKCPECGRLILGRKWLRPYNIIFASRKFPDILYASPEILFSERFKVLYEDAGLKGIISFEPIDNYRFARKSTKEVTPPQYYRPIISHSNMTINYDKSDFEWLKSDDYERVCPVCRPNAKLDKITFSLVLNQERYNGEDIFYLYERGQMICLSQNFVDWAVTNQITNFICSNIQNLYIRNKKAILGVEEQIAYTVLPKNTNMKNY